MAYAGLTVEYMVNEAGDRPFIPSNENVVASVTEVNQCTALSPDAVVVVVGEPEAGEG